jgi:hypothetical protein
MIDGSDANNKRFFNRAQIYIMFGVGFMLGKPFILSAKKISY